MKSAASLEYTMSCRPIRLHAVIPQAVRQEEEKKQECRQLESLTKNVASQIFQAKLKEASKDNTWTLMTFRGCHLLCHSKDSFEKSGGGTHLRLRLSSQIFEIQ